MSMCLSDLIREVPVVDRPAVARMAQAVKVAEMKSDAEWRAAEEKAWASSAPARRATWSSEVAYHRGRVHAYMEILGDQPSLHQSLDMLDLRLFPEPIGATS